MGNACGGGGSKPDPNEQRGNRDIEERMADGHAEDQQVIKLLLLGAGESGKSTLFKQFQKLYSEDGMPEEEKAGFIPNVYNNTIMAIKTLSDNVGKYGGLKTDGGKESQQVVDALHGDEVIDSALAQHISTLWQDPGIQETHAHSSEFQITDSSSYFMDRVTEIGKDDYEITFQDILRVRVRTTGIVESKFTFKGSRFAVFDVGGQRNERKKWIHCFQGVTAVLFVCGLSGYDQTLFEDEKTNRITEALELFDETCNSKYFAETAVILFLNKRDLFEKKIQKVSLKTCFDDYEGDNSYEDGIKFITQKFEARNKKTDTPIYIHVTTATDTKNVGTVFAAVRDIVIQVGLTEAGL